MKCSLIPLLLLAFSGISNAKRETSLTTIIIGGIFHGDDDITQRVFLTTFQSLNNYQNRFKFVPQMFNISRTDSFKAQEIACKLAEMGALAIFGPGTVETSGIVSSIAEKLDIPHLIYHWKTKPRQWQDYIDPKMTLNFYPDSEVLARSMAGILIDYTWKSYTIVYENEEHLIRLKDIIQIHRPNEENSVTMLKLEDDNYAILLKKVKHSQVKNIILDISTDKIIEFLKAAKLVGMTGDYNKFFITNLDANTLDYRNVSESLVNITTVSLSNVSSIVMADAIKNINAYGDYPIEPHHMPVEAALVHDAIHFLVRGLQKYVEDPRDVRVKMKSCSDIRDLSRNNQPSFGYGFLEFLRKSEYDGITGRVEFIKENLPSKDDNKPITPDDSPKRGSRTEFMLDVVQYNKDTMLFYRIAIYDTTHGVIYDLTETDMDEKLYAAISNKTFTIVTREEAPFLFYRTLDANGNPLMGNDQFSGYAVELIKRIQAQLRFKYVFKLVTTGNGKFLKEKNEWDGLIGEILKGHADLGIADLTITYNRKKVVDFTTPFMNLGISILFVKPIPKAKNLFSFLDPFKTDVWIYTGLAYIFISALVFVLSRINSDDWESSHPCNQDPDEVESIWNILNCVWLMMGSIMGQGSDILPKGSSTRIVTGMWWFFALIMLASYTANLAAFLTSDRLSSTINGAEDLSKQVEIKYGAVRDGSTLRFFMESNYSTYQRMWAAMESNGDLYNPVTNNEGVSRVEKEGGKYAFMMESVPMEYQIKRRCSLMQVGEWLDSKGYGIALPLESPYRKFFSAQILKLQESGVLAQLKEDWWKADKNATECTPMEKPHDDLDIGNVGGVFLVLIGGCLVAFIVACFEFFMNVQHVAITEKMTHWDAFKSELSFAFNFWIVTKPVRSQSNEIVSRKSTPLRSLKSRSRFGSETRSLKNKSTRSLNFDRSSLHEATSKSLLNLH